jgi:hypothetical protein
VHYFWIIWTHVHTLILRYPGTPADLYPGSLACSQLQNYDPDRALTDYITRLEALQRRLGTVQSGALFLPLTGSTTGFDPQLFSLFETP